MKKHLLIFLWVQLFMFLTINVMGQCTPTLGPMYQSGVACGNSTTATIVITGLIPNESFEVYYFITNYEHAKVFTIDITSNPTGDATATIPVILADSGQLFEVTELNNITFGCSGFSSAYEYDNRAELFVSRPPQIKVTQIPSSLCAGQSDTLVATGAASTYGYIWNPMTSLQILTDSSVIASPTVTTTYFVSGTGSGECTATDTFTLTVNTPPNVSVSGLSSYYCANASPVVLSGGLPTGGMYSGTGVIDGTFSPVQAGVGGPYTITYTYTDTNNCSNSATEQVSVNALPSVSVSGLNSSYCVNATSVILTGGTPNGGTFSGNGVSSGTFYPSQAGVGGPYTITYTYTDINNCTNIATEQVNVDSIPVIQIIPDTVAICLGTSTNLSLVGAVNYVWSPSTGLSDSTSSSVVAEPTQNVTYTVTGTNSNGCSGTNYVSVTVNPLPKIIASPNPASYCTGGSSAINTSGAETYIWTPSTNLNSTTGSLIMADPTVSTTYTVTGTDSLGCSDSTSVAITVDPYPNLSLSHDTTIYSGDSSRLTATSNGSVSWTPSSGLSCTTCNDPVADPTVTTTYIATATEGLCSISDTVIITVITTTSTERLAVDKETLIVYPNPTSGRFILQWNNQPNCTVEIYNIVGKEVYRSTLNNSPVTFDLSAQLPGLYFMCVRSEQNIQVSKITIMK